MTGIAPATFYARDARAGRPRARYEGIPVDTFVDWLNVPGYRIERIDNYGEWLSRFEIALRSLVEEQRQISLLAVLGPCSRPQTPVAKSRLPSQRFCAALEATGLNIPHLSAELINKYVADLRPLASSRHVAS